MNKFFDILLWISIILIFIPMIVVNLLLIPQIFQILGGPSFSLGLIKLSLIGLMMLLLTHAGKKFYFRIQKKELNSDELKKIHMANGLIGGGIVSTFLSVVILEYAMSLVFGNSVSGPPGMPIISLGVILFVFGISSIIIGVMRQ